MLWMAELIAEVKTWVFHIPKLFIDWFVITDWHVFKRMKSFTKKKK